MHLNDAQVTGLNTACNEATWIGLHFNEAQAWAGITLSVLTLPEQGPAPDDCRVQLILQPVSRIAASRRDGMWNDEKAMVLPLSVEQLESAVVDVQAPVYGWSFFNIPDREGFAPWAHRLSLDIKPVSERTENTLNLQQDINPFLKLRIWFGELRIFGPDRREVPLQAFIEGGRRWWDGLYAEDPRTQGAGIVPLKREGS
jgi:hypothetical protein